MPFEPWLRLRAGAAVSGATLALLWSAAVVLAGRRLAGALVDPLSPGVMAATVLLAGCAALVARWGASQQGVWNRWGPPAAATAGMLVLAAAISLPGASTIGLVAVWGLLVAEEVCGWWPKQRIAVLPKRPTTRVTAPRETAPDKPPVKEPSPDLLPADENVERQLLDRRDADGQRRVEGRLRAWFAPRQRTSSEHVSFCPPFAATPMLNFEQAAGPPVRIKLAQLLPYGARFDIKLLEAAEETLPVVISFTAAEPHAAP